MDGVVWPGQNQRAGGEKPIGLVHFCPRSTQDQRGALEKAAGKVAPRGTYSPAEPLLGPAEEANASALLRVARGRRVRPVDVLALCQCAAGPGASAAGTLSRQKDPVKIRSNDPS